MQQGSAFEPKPFLSSKRMQLFRSVEDPQRQLPVLFGM
jgi:hypothetical protein